MKTFKNQPIKKGKIVILMSLVLGSFAAAMNMTETDGHNGTNGRV